MPLNLPVAAQWISLFLLLGCQRGSGPTQPLGNVPGPELPVVVPEVPVVDEPIACDAHAGTQVSMSNRTLAWGLSTVTGSRVTSGDLDGDGYPDLIIHGMSAPRRADVAAGERLTWLLMNRPAPGGGRTFVDRTVESGLFAPRDGTPGALRSAQLAVLGDVDNDGDWDVYSGTFNSPNRPDTNDRSEIFLNDGKGNFRLAERSDVSPAELLTTSAATFTDTDRDGRLDVLVGTWYANSSTSSLGTQAQLMRGLGDGRFQRITHNVGLTTFPSGQATNVAHRPLYGVTACDLNDDGAPELMLSAYGRNYNLMYQNDGKGRFAEVGLAKGFAADDNLDYSDNHYMLCYCTVHPEHPKCAGRPRPRVVCPTPADANWSFGRDDQPYRLTGNNFTTYCGDLDGDGDPDLYTTTIVHWHIGQSSDPSEVLRNEVKDGAFSLSRPGRSQMGLDWPHRISTWNEGGLIAVGGDLDLDGRTDLLVGGTDYEAETALMFHQKPGGKFEEVAAPWGISHPCMIGATLADFDRDGDLDAVVGSSRMREWCAARWPTNEVHFYENASSPGANWLAIRLVGNGTTTNTSGIGAKVTVDAGGTKLVQELNGGYGHYGLQNDTVLFFGLGACAKVTSITVRWPDFKATTQEWKHIPAGRVIELQQGDVEVREVLR